MDISKINVCSNADILSDKIISKTWIPMFRCEDVFDFYSEEPISIEIKEKKESKKTIYEQVFRIRVWNHSGLSYAWVLYSKEREDFNSIIARKIIWDMELDKQRLKKELVYDKDKALMGCPAIRIINRFVSEKNIYPLKEAIKDIDIIAEKGVIWDNDEHLENEWRDLELRRLYDWGQIHLVWSPYKKSRNIEDKIKKTIKVLEYLIEQECDKIYRMEFHYTMSPEELFVD